MTQLCLKENNLIYNYLYFHFFDLFLKKGRTHANQSAHLCMCTLINFYTLPVLLGIVFRYNLPVPKIVFMAFAVLYMYLVYYANRVYLTKKKLVDIENRYMDNTKKNRVIGRTLALGLLITSPVVFFLIAKIVS